jgi:hypothetical protein
VFHFHHMSAAFGHGFENIAHPCLEAFHAHAIIINDNGAARLDAATGTGTGTATGTALWIVTATGAEAKPVADQWDDRSAILFYRRRSQTRS